MHNPIFLLLLLLPCKIFSQIDSTVVNKFEKLRYSHDYLNPDYDFTYLNDDSANITIKYNKNLTVTETYFKLKERKLIVNFYFEKDSLFFITTSEICPTKAELTCDSRYFIVANKVVQQDHSSIKAISLGIPTSIKELQEAHTCPERFSYAFLEKYIWIVFSKIKGKFPH